MKRLFIGLLVVSMVGLGIVMSGCDSIVGPTDNPTTTTAAPATTTTTTAAATTTTTTAAGTTTTTTTTTTTSTTLPSLPSISGFVYFGTTSDPVKGGVAVRATTGIITRNATADSTTGAFTINDCPPGPYTMEGTKSDWLISSKVVNVATADVTGENLTATPEYWTILNLGGSDSFKCARNFGDGRMLALGSLLFSTDTGESWSPLTPPTSDAFVGCDSGPAGTVDMMLFSGTGWLYVSTNEGADAFLGSDTAHKLPPTPIQMCTIEVIAGDLKADVGILPVTRTLANLPIGGGEFFPITTMSPGFPTTGWNNVACGEGGTDEVYLVGDDGLYIKGSIAGPWVQVATSATFESRTLTGVSAGGGSLMLVTGTTTESGGSGAIFISYDSGESWVEDLSGVPYSVNYPGFDNNSMYVVGDHGLIMMRHN